MTEASSQSSLPGSYWDLHRNTLLFSALLLIICIPGVHTATGQSFLWISFSDVGLTGLRVIALLAAIYAIIVYVIEWSKEPLELYRKDNKLAATSRQNMDNLISAVTYDLPAITDRFNEVIDHGRRHVEARFVDDYALPTAEIDEYVRRSYDLTVRRHRPENALLMFERDIAQRYALNGPPDVRTVQEMVRQTVEHMCIEAGRDSGIAISKTGSQALNQFLDRAANESAILSARLNALQERSAGISPLRLAFNLSLFRFKAKSWSRIIGIGLVVPLAVFVTALGFCVAQLGAGHLWPAFAADQKAPITKPAGKPALAPASTKA